METAKQKTIFNEENSARLKEKFGRPVFYFDEIDSTNTYVRENELPGGSLVIAARQSAGRGRRGNSFSSSQSGIYFSYVHKASDQNDELLTVKAGLAVCMALEGVLSSLAQDNPRPMIKWVNDIYVDDRKLCGILCERTKDRVIIGIGINMNTEGLEEELRKNCIGLLELTEDRAADINVDILKEEIIRLILKNLETDISAEETVKAFKDRSYLTGREISFVQNGERKTGLVTGINEKCNLMVRTGNEILTLFSGEVHTIRKK